MLSIFLSFLISINLIFFPTIPKADYFSQASINFSRGIKTEAKSILVIDPENQEIFFSKNYREILPIASLTKLMTSLVLLDYNLDLNKTIKIDPQDQPEELRAVQVGIGPNEEVRLKDLFYSLLIRSANEAANALVRSVSAKEDFVKSMNEKAKVLNLKKTFFSEPTGVDFKNQSNADDLAYLTWIAFSNPLISQISRQVQYYFSTQGPAGEKYYYLKNQNPLFNSYLKNKILGAKTGYLDEAGYCFTGLFEIKNRKIVIVILGASSSEIRWQEVKGLIWWLENRIL